MKLINQIKLKKAEKALLFFDEKRIGEEVKANLVSFSVDGVTVSQTEKQQLISVLLEAVDKIEIDLDTSYPNRQKIFYLWFDQVENLLRWTVTSSIDKKTTPFSSVLVEVTIDEIVELWLEPQSSDNGSKLSYSDIENMSSLELRNLANSLEAPSLDIYIRMLS